jgi:hypothetical protein
LQQYRQIACDTFKLTLIPRDLLLKDLKDGRSNAGSFNSAAEVDQYRRIGEGTASLAVHTHIQKLCKERITVSGM